MRLDNSGRDGASTVGRDTRTLLILLYVIGGTVIIGGSIVAQSIFGNTPDTTLLAIAALGGTCIIAAHVVMIVCRESPRFGYPNIVGRRAVAEGLIGLLVFGGLEVYVLYELLRNLLTK